MKSASARVSLALLSATTMSLGACLVDGPEVDLGDNDVRLTVFHTGDWHSRLLPYVYDPPAPIETLGLKPENAPFGGVARLATLLKQERERSDRWVWLDTGDCFQGAPIFNVFSGEAEIRMQAELGLDAAVIGNHEFDLGVSNYVAQYRAWGRHAALAANYDPENFLVPGNRDLGEIMSPYVILNKNGLKVLVIGHGNFSSLNSLGEGGNSIGATPMEHNTITQLYIDLLAPQVDVVAVITHLGIEYDLGLVEGYKQYFDMDRMAPPNFDCIELPEVNKYECDIPGVQGMDFILGGHFHIVLNPPRVAIDVDGREVPIVHSGAFMQFLGRFDTVLRKAEKMGRDPWFGWEVVDHRYEIKPIDATLDHDPETYRDMEPYLLTLGLEHRLNRPIAFSPTGVTRSSSNGTDSAMGNLVANAIRTRNRVRSDFSLTNTAGIRDNIPPGPVTAEMLFNVFPFENTITTFFLSGREVQEVLDFVGSRSTGRGCRSQVQVSGVEFMIRCDCEQNRTGCCEDARGWAEFPPGCVEDIFIDGQPLNPNGTYEVGANDYMAQGGSGFEMLRRNTTQRDSGISLRTAVEEYMQKQPICSDEEIAALGPCDAEIDANSPACQWQNLTDKFGPLPCLKQDGLVDGRIQRAVPQ